MVHKNRLYWTMQAGGWVLYASLQIVFSVSAFGSISTSRIIFLLYEAVLCLFVTHAFRVFLTDKKWLFLGLARLILNIVVCVSIMALIVYFLRVPVSILLGLFDRRVAFDVGHILGLTSIYGFIFSLWSILYFTYQYFERYNRSLKYEASMVEIELNNLKSQLNPHFIFNALNSIRALVEENPTKSKLAINQLSNILRNSLTTEKKGLTNFEDELKTVKDYLGLESIRFEERLRTEFIIHIESKNYFVPSLMIQTLVENGVKHGISKLTQGGIIQVKTKVVHDQLIIQIRNSGQLDSHYAKQTKNGLGLKNTTQRLRLLYGSEASFKIINENDKFVLTEIIIPQLYNYENINRG